MDIKKIQELVKIISKTEITEIAIESSEGKITIKQKDSKMVAVAPPYPVVLNQSNQPEPAPTIHKESPAEISPQSEKQQGDKNLVIIKSPMIGTFYRKSGPNKPNFVEVGQKISKGSTICIIEAMKLFNEIESEWDGVVQEILLEDATPVEFDQPLFAIKVN